jgi:hypothetical protein
LYVASQQGNQSFQIKCFECAFVHDIVNVITLREILRCRFKPGQRGEFSHPHAIMVSVISL